MNGLPLQTCVASSSMIQRIVTRGAHCLISTIKRSSDLVCHARDLRFLRRMVRFAFEPDRRAPTTLTVIVGFAKTEKAAFIEKGVSGHCRLLGTIGEIVA